MQPLLNLRNQAGGNRLVNAFEFQLLNRACCFTGRQIREFIDGVALQTHVARHGVQTRSAASRTITRFPFVDPLRFAFCGELAFQN